MTTWIDVPIATLGEPMWVRCPRCNSAFTEAQLYPLHLHKWLSVYHAGCARDPITAPVQFEIVIVPDEAAS